ncbi:hypothetical protein [Streptomyces sp. SID12501]|uniref:Ig-like domain-containing protein n=1 Tax=Streptomyces sp. SID12501 TaxID=2706042 RepID=A0A6B3BWV8_9ACTN|nr:hypothetical protein [Streptomyces sp. SID12501]NEC88740.1 hypothetical protein [Streptomyces sp. SID12501]
MTHARRRLRAAASLSAASALSLATLGAGSGVQAADTPKTALGKEGQRLTVSASADLAPGGETLQVTGTGYDRSKGIYVALCKDNGDNRVPSPCLGGADTSGDGAASRWIVPEGDTYEGDLAIAYGDGGTFDVTLDIEAVGDGLDCAEVPCAIVTRVDHRGSGDRSQDVRVPVTFTGQDPADGGEGVDVPAGTARYRQAAEFTTTGKPLDVLLHPDSGKLYVGSDNLADTADIDERGLYVLDPADGTVRSHISQAPGTNGVLRTAAAAQLAAALPGDGVLYRYPLRGIGTAKDGDQSAKGVWLTGATITDLGPGTTADTVLVAQGATLSELETATGTVRRTLALDGGRRLAVDSARAAVWSAGASGGQLRRVDTGTFTVTATAELPDAAIGFVETDPATGNVWVGAGSSVLVFDQGARLLATVEGTDEAAAAAFDPSTGRVFVVRQDNGDTSGGGDNNGSLAVYDTTTHEVAVEAVPLPGNHSQLGAAAITVAAGGTTVYVTSPAEGKVVKLDQFVSPKVVQAPTDQTVTVGDTVTLIAQAEGTPAPTVRWQVSTDGAQTWQDVPDATGTTYAFTAEAGHDGHHYRAEFTNTAGITRTTPVILTVTGEASTGGGDSGGSAGGDTGGDGGTTGGTDGGVGTGGSTTSGTTTGGSTSGGGATGGSTTGGSTTGGTDTTGGSAATGSTTSASGSTTGGSLAATGVGALGMATAAAALTAAGWLAFRRGRGKATGGTD